MEPESVGSLDELVDTLASTIEHTIPLSPEAKTALTVTKKLYEHRKTIVTTIENIADTWTSDKSTEEKIADTLVHVAKGAYDVGKKELKNYVIAEGSRQIVDLADPGDGLGILSKTLSQKGLTVDVRGFVEDAIGQEMDTLLSRFTP